MKIKSQKDFWSGLMFIVVGISFAFGATYYSFGQSARPGPGYFPFGLGAILAILGAVVLFTSLTVETEGGDPVGGIAWRPLIMILGILTFFGFALPRLGMVITLPLLVIVSSFASDEAKLLEAILNAAILTVASWFIFVYSLNLTIPMWPAFLAPAAAS
jgi:Tripartite tricarboxylate transporter TctB family